jgi:hypothetical protein
VSNASELRPTKEGAEISQQPGGIIEAARLLGQQIEQMAAQANVSLTQGSTALIRAKFCFVLDCTGSMAAEIAAVKKKLSLTISEVHRKFGTKVDLQIAFVGYRDVGGKFFSLRDDSHELGVAPTRSSIRVLQMRSVSFAWTSPPPPATQLPS